MTVAPTHPPSPAGPQAGPEAAPRSLWQDARRRFVRSKLAVASLAIVALYLLAGLASFLPVFERDNEQGQTVGKIWDPVGESYEPPRWGAPAVWLGTDILGRSVLWRVLYGSRVALIITLGASALAITLGTMLGVVAGYFGGWVDALIVWLFSTVSSIPWLLLVIALAYALEGYEGLKAYFGGVASVIIALGLTDWVGLCRLLRGEVIRLRDRDFVAAARAVGAGNGRILFRHILPNVLHLIIITFSLGAVSYVQAEVVLAFLGLGVTQKPSWGRMIDDAKLELLRGVWWQATAATVAILVLCLALNILGDVLRDALDPRLRGTD